MLRSKTARASQFRHVKSSPPKRPGVGEHWADVWLPRLSHLAQFGLFLFTLAISYFTVLPLYQKAVLEEAIAKKELELSVLNKSYESTYARIRIYAMQALYWDSARCTGLLNRSTERQQDQKQQTFTEELLARDLPGCLLERAKTLRELKDLNPRDTQTFFAVLQKISKEIEVQRGAALIEYRMVPRKIMEADVAKLPPDSYRMRAQIFIERHQGGVPDMIARRKIAEDVARDKIGSEYLRFFRDRVSSLEEIQW